MAGGLFTAKRKILTAYNSRMSYTMVIGLIPFGGKDLYLNPTIEDYLRLILIISIIFLIILLVLFHKDKKYNLLLTIGISCMFIYSFTYSLCEFVYTASASNQEKVQPLADLNKTLSNANVNHISKVYVVNTQLPKPGIFFAFSNYSVEYMEKIESNYGKYGKVEQNSIFISSKDEGLDYLFDEIYFVAQIGEYYIWGYGDELKTDLGQIGYDCQKRSIPVSIYSATELYTTEDNNIINNDKVICVLPGEKQFGPYEKLYRGEYRVEIYGKNLRNGDYACYYNYGMNNLRISGIKKTDSYVEYDIKSLRNIENVEFVCENMHESSMVIDYIIVTPVKTECSISVHNAEKLNVIQRNYFVEDLYTDFRSHIISYDKTILSRRYVRLRPKGKVVINRLTMSEGRSILTLSGTNLSLADINIFTEDGEKINYEYYEQDSMEKLQVALEEEGTITIQIENNSETDIDFSSVGVLWLGEN